MLTLDQGEEGSECTGYLKDTGCSWTREWACPSSERAGTQGYASDDASLGFRCCCPPDGITPADKSSLIKACLGKTGNSDVASIAVAMGNKLMGVKYLSGGAVRFLNNFGHAMMKHSVGDLTTVAESGVLSTSLTSWVLAKRLSASLRNDKGRLYKRYVRTAHRLIRKSRNSGAHEALNRVMTGPGFQRALKAAGMTAKVPIPADVIRSGKQLMDKFG